MLPDITSLANTPFIVTRRMFDLRLKKKSLTYATVARAHMRGGTVYVSHGAKVSYANRSNIIARYRPSLREEFQYDATTKSKTDISVKNTVVPVKLSR